MADLYLSVTRRTSTSEQVCCQEAVVATVCLLAALLTNVHGSKVFFGRKYMFSLKYKVNKYIEDTYKMRSLEL